MVEIYACITGSSEDCAPPCTHHCPKLLPVGALEDHRDLFSGTLVGAPSRHDSLPARYAAL